jgi:cbb3-type cytochrome oxidase subunit 3
MIAAAAGAIPPKTRSAIAIIITLVIIAIVIFVLFKANKGANSIMEMLGLKRDKDEEKLDKAFEGRNEQAQDATGSPWSPQFYKIAQAAGHTVTLIKAAEADRLAKIIWDSVGVFYDTPTAATAAVKQVPTQAALSFLAERFAKNYDRDLWNWLAFKFDTDEQKKELTNMAHFVEKLPKYTR